MTIRREGERLFARETGQPGDELLPQSAAAFFLRVCGRAAIFARDSRGKVDRLILDADGTKSTFFKISDRSSKPTRPPTPPTLVQVDSKVLDTWVGRYELPSGRYITITREGEHLLALYGGWMGCELFPASETTFCNTVVPLKFTFSKGVGEGAATVAVTCPLFEREFTGNGSKIGNQWATVPEVTCRF